MFISSINTMSGDTYRLLYWEMERVDMTAEWSQDRGVPAAAWTWIQRGEALDDRWFGTIVLSLAVLFVLLPSFLSQSDLCVLSCLVKKDHTLIAGSHPHRRFTRYGPYSVSICRQNT